jgi:hypothetical protein
LGNRGNDILAAADRIGLSPENERDATPLRGS